MKLAAIYLPVGAKNRKTFGEWYGTSRGSFRPCDQTLESPDSKASGVFFRRFSLPPHHYQDTFVSLAASGDCHSCCDSPSGPCDAARASSRTTTLRGTSRPISVIAIPVAEAGQHAPGVGFAVNTRVGKPARGGQDVREDGGRQVGQPAQWGIWIKVTRREQLGRPQASGQRTEEQKHFLKLNVGREGEPNLRQGEDEGRLDALQHLGLEFLPEAVVITDMAGVDPDPGGLRGGFKPRETLEGGGFRRQWRQLRELPLRAKLWLVLPIPERVREIAGDGGGDTVAGSQPGGHLEIGECLGPRQRDRAVQYLAFPATAADEIREGLFGVLGTGIGDDVPSFCEIFGLLRHWLVCRSGARPRGVTDASRTRLEGCGPVSYT